MTNHDHEPTIETLTQEQIDNAIIYTPQEFITRYEALCKEMRYTLTAVPTWINTNHNTYEMSIQFRVDKT